MSLHIQDDKEFRPLLDALKDELVSAAVTFRLYQDLLAAKEKYSREMSQSWTFWSLTIDALADSTVYRIAKAYDHNKGSLDLRNFLALVQERKDLFNPDKFLERLKDNPYAESLSQISRVPKDERISAHLEFVHAASNPLVKRLVTWRDKYYAHRDPDHVLDPQTVDALLITDVETLITEGVKIINCYSDLFTASVDSTKMIGHQDYESVLKAVRYRLDGYEAEIQRRLAELQGEASG